MVLRNFFHSLLLFQCILCHNKQSLISGEKIKELKCGTWFFWWGSLIKNNFLLPSRK
jgi:hypothetical protein